MDIYLSFQFVVTKLLHSIPQNVGQRNTNGAAFSQWHELLGWFCPGPDSVQNENLVLIKKQVHLLWNHRTVKILLGKFLYVLRNILIL